jgi:hypothetical protein
MGNDAIQNEDDLHDVLRHLAGRIDAERPLKNMVIHDNNGNRIGQMDVITWPDN